MLDVTAESDGVNSAMHKQQSISSLRSSKAWDTCTSFCTCIWGLITLHMAGQAGVK